MPASNEKRVISENDGKNCLNWTALIKPFHHVLMVTISPTGSMKARRSCHVVDERLEMERTDGPLSQ
jgi:hypothetical protein